MKNTRMASIGAAAVVAGALLAFGTAGAASAADPAIIGEGHVTLDFSVTPGSVAVDVWTKNLSEVEAWGRAVVIDVDGTPYPFGPKLFAPGEEFIYAITLDGYTCDDLGDASAFAFGFATENSVEPDWSSGEVRYPDERITVVGCDTPTPPVTPPVTPGTPTGGTNALPPAKTDGAELAGSSSSPLFGLTFTLGAILAAAVGARVTGALKRR